MTAQMIVFFIFAAAAAREKRIFERIRLAVPVKWFYLKEIGKIGFPASLQNLIYAGISMLLTRLIAGWGDTAVAVQRVGGQIESVSWMVGEGFAAAVNSFTGQNYGAKRMERVKKGFSVAVRLVSVWGLFTSALLILMAEPIFHLFIREPEVLAEGVNYLRILGFSQLFMLVELTAVGAFAGLGRTAIPSVLSILLTSARLPLASFLSGTGLGLSGIWWALTISSIAKGCLFYGCFRLILYRISAKFVKKPIDYFEKP